MSGMMSGSYRSDLAGEVFPYSPGNGTNPKPLPFMVESPRCRPELEASPTLQKGTDLD